LRVQSRRNFHTLVARAAPIVVPSLLVGEGIERFSRNDDGEEVGVPPHPFFVFTALRLPSPSRSRMLPISATLDTEFGQA